MEELGEGVKLNGYTDLFGAEGVLVEWAKKQSEWEGTRKVGKAVTYLERSIAEREQAHGRHRGEGNVKHDFTLRQIKECVEALKGICDTGER